MIFSDKNVAFRGNTCQSQSPDASCSSNRAVDGILGCCGTYYTYTFIIITSDCCLCSGASATGSQLKPWWAVDFGSPLSIGTVKITTAYECNRGKKFVLHPNPVMLKHNFWRYCFIM